MNASEKFIHPFDPIYNDESEILILGSFPSVKSREVSFYYGHPLNRFWKLLALLYDEETGESIDERKAFLLSHHIALWDVIKECEICGSSDASIRNVKVNDLSLLMDGCKIKKIYANGKTAGKLFNSYVKDKIQYDCIVLPSSSPANAAYKLEDLYREW